MRVALLAVNIERLLCSKLPTGVWLRTTRVCHSTPKLNGIKYCVYTATDRLPAIGYSSYPILNRHHIVHSRKSPFAKHATSIQAARYSTQPTDESKSKIVVGSLIGISCFITAVWSLDPAVQYMKKNYALSIYNIRQGRWWTMITSTFSHASIMHLLMNMMGLWFFGLPVCQLIGVPRFLALYFGGAIISSSAQLMYLDKILRQRYGIQIDYRLCIGASGSLMAILSFYTLVWPSSMLELFFVIRMRAATALLGVVLFDIFGLFVPIGNLGHAGHLGGAAFGLLYGLSKLRRLR